MQRTLVRNPSCPFSDSKGFCREEWNKNHSSWIYKNFSDDTLDVPPRTIELAELIELGDFVMTELNLTSHLPAFYHPR
jgi:hypothetical protein